MHNQKESHLHFCQKRKRKGKPEGLIKRLKWGKKTAGQSRKRTGRGQKSVGTGLMDFNPREGKGKGRICRTRREEGENQKEGTLNRETRGELNRMVNWTL